eukprot:4084978-Prymnesium_polylepis.2
MSSAPVDSLCLAAALACSMSPDFGFAEVGRLAALPEPFSLACSCGGTVSAAAAASLPQRPPIFPHRPVLCDRGPGTKVPEPPSVTQCQPTVTPLGGMADLDL